MQPPLSVLIFNKNFIFALKAYTAATITAHINSNTLPSKHKGKSSSSGSINKNFTNAIGRGGNQNFEIQNLCVKLSNNNNTQQSHEQQQQR